MNDKEEWVVTGVQELEEMVNSFYKDLFRKEGEHEEFCLKGKFPKLDQLELELIEADITDEKVKGAIFNKGSFKALGEDGFQTPFFFFIKASGRWLILPCVALSRICIGIPQQCRV